jgi:RNA polymerase sigma-70 factor (ECF subfamily)
MPDSEVDVAGFDEFYLRSVRRVVGAIALITHDLHAAEDAAQEAFSRAAVRWDRVGKMDRPDMWVIRVGTNTAITSWKRHRREGGLEVDRIDTQHGDSTEADRIIGEKTLKWGLEHLTPKQRAAVVMHHAQGWDVDDIATELHTSESTVRTHLRRAREKLRGLLGPEGML